MHTYQVTPPELFFVKVSQNECNFSDTDQLQAELDNLHNVLIKLIR